MENIPRIHDVGHPRRDSTIFMEDIHCKLEQFNNRIIFVSMHNDIVWGEKETRKNVFKIRLQLRNTLADSLSVVGLSWDLDQKRNGRGPILINQTEIGTEMQK